MSFQTKEPNGTENRSPFLGRGMEETQRRLREEQRVFLWQWRKIWVDSFISVGPRNRERALME